jgi:hypothetical protein
MAEVKAWVWSGNAAKLLADNILVGATTVSATELGYLSGVTSAIQTQLNGKEPTINLTINRAVISDGSGGLTVSATTATEVGYLSGVTSAIQTQLDGKEPTISLTGNRAVVSDAGGALTVSSATDTEVGYLSGVTSAIQTQIDSKTGIADNETITGTWIFNNLITFSGEVSTDAAHLGGYGLLPVGAIVAYNPGYYTNGSNGGFAISGPAGNSVTQVNAFLNAKGWYVCNGAAVNVAASPIWNAAGRYLPNLDDGRFLRGSAEAGTQGGAATSSIDHTHSVTSNVTVSDHTLAVANLPVHSHTINHNHAAFTSGGESAHTHGMTHVHSINHDHAAFNTASGGSHTHTNARVNAAIGPDYAVADISATNVGYGTWSTSGGAHTHSINVPAFSGNSGGSTTNGTTARNSTDAGSNHTHSIDVPNFTGSSGNEGSGTAITHTVTNNAVTTLGASVTSISIEPTYLNTFYIVRVF